MKRKRGETMFMLCAFASVVFVSIAMGILIAAIGWLVLGLIAVAVVIVGVLSLIRNFISARTVSR